VPIILILWLFKHWIVCESLSQSHGSISWVVGQLKSGFIVIDQIIVVRKTFAVVCVSLLLDESVVFKLFSVISSENELIIFEIVVGLFIICCWALHNSERLNLKISFEIVT
jgi:hypothetical protein